MKKLLLCSAMGGVFTAFVVSPAMAEDVDLTASQMMERALKSQASMQVSEEAQTVESIQKNDPASAAMIKRKLMLEAKAEEEAKAKVAAALAEEQAEKAAITELKMGAASEPEDGVASVSEVKETTETEVEITETDTGVVIKETTTETVEIEMPEKMSASASPEAGAEDVSEAEAEDMVAEVVAVEPAAGGPAWGYHGANGAAYWGALDDAYATCADGQEQSPINIAAYLEEDLPALVMDYQDTPLSVSNNGQTLKVSLSGGSTLESDGETYALDHMHFHTPSEHYLDGAPYPMAVHFVHKAADGGLAVVGVMMKLGAHNPVIEGVWQNAPIQAGGTKTVEDVKISAADLMPEAMDYYRYDGSLTTPPCSEGVKWHVLKEPIEVSEKQLKAFQALFPVNARPVQPLGERVVLGN